MIDHLISSIAKAENGETKLPGEVFKIWGMSSRKTRILLNWLCSMPNACYLEIGTWRGSTLISALYSNETIRALAIDNFSQFKGEKARDALMENLAIFQCALPKFKFIDADCFSSVATSAAVKGGYNLFFYDGEHGASPTSKALMTYEGSLRDHFILLLDDYRMPGVRQGYANALDQLSWRREYENVLPALHNGDKERWWNGLYVAVIEKGPA